MNTLYLLVIILQATLGAPAKVSISAEKPVPLEDCIKAGEQTASWLAQDFVRVEWYCLPVSPEGSHE